MSEKLTAKDIRTQYSMGERDFFQLQLRRIDLQKAKLPRINLQGSDLTGADLRGADLSGANLSKCYLNEANLNNTNLMGANLTGTRLIKANLTKANCQKAIFQEAYFTNAFLTKANLSKADLTGTIFNGTYLSGTIFQEASYNNTTCFDKGLDPVKLGMIKWSLFTATTARKATIAQLVANFENITNVTINYLGRTITVKNFERSRPDIEWLQQFSIDKQGKISYQGSLTNQATLMQLKWLEKWTNSFVKKSSFIIHDLPCIIEKKKLALTLELDPSN